MLRGSVFHAFSFSAMLILCFRILIKYNSTTPVFFYSIVLIITLCGIIAGSLLYKRTVDRPANKFLTLATLQVVAGFAALICYAFLHFFALKVFNRIPDTGSLLQIALRQSALFAVLLFIPSAIYGISFPLAARLYPKRIQHTGRNFAKLNCLVFFSVISAMIITPFILVPLAGIELSFILLSLIMLLSGVYLILRDSRLIRGFRVGYGFLAIVLFVMIASFVYLLDFRQTHENDGGSIEGSTASISMTEQHGDKYIYLNNTYYFGSDPDGLKEQVLAGAIPAVLKPGADSALVIGFGTGITAYVLDQSGVASLQITEIFPEIVRMSSNNFADENSDILTGPRTEIAIEDVRSYLFRKQGHLDLITMGSDQLSIFPGRYSEEFYRLCKSKLSDDGILCQIIPLNTPNFSSILKTAASDFESNSLWLISSEKLLLVSSKSQSKINYCQFSEMFSTLNKKGQLSRIGINDPTVMAGYLLLTNDKITGLTNNSGIITDNNPYSSLAVNKHEIASPLPMVQKYSGSNNYFDFSGSCIEDSSAIHMRINQINRSLVQQAVQSSSKPRQRIVDFYEVNRSLLQQYL
jgi:predicted membrane-bound spermidine synthase